MDILQDIGSSVTGSIHKAMLLLRKQNISDTLNKSPVELREELLAGSSESLIKNPSAALNALPGMSKVKKAAGNDYHILQVKYNPSSIHFSTQAGSYIQSGPGGMGVNQITQITVPSRTTMQVELIFDEMNIVDAFMWEKFDLTGGSALSAAAGIAKQTMSKYNGYSLHKQVDGIVSLMGTGRREVIFYWSEMAFMGELTGVNATYTMFNPQGNPVRAKVALTIYQSEESENTADVQYWNKAFEKLFGDYSLDNTVDASKNIEVVQNLINF